MDVVHTPQSELEPRTKKLISRLYQAESKAVQQRNKLVDQIEELDKRVEEITARREELAKEFQTIRDAKSVSADKQQAFEELLTKVEEEQKDWSMRTEEVISKAGQNLAVWADQIADAGRSTWENLVGRAKGAKDGWEEMRDAYNREADQTLKQIDSKVSELEAKAASLNGAAKESVQKQIDAFKKQRKELEAEIAKLKTATEDSWDSLKSSLEERVDAARDAIRK
jgi:archaellum component FlaC